MKSLRAARRMHLLMLVFGESAGNRRQLCSVAGWHYKLGITNLEVVMLSPFARFISATLLGLALLMLPTLTSSSIGTAYAGDSRRYEGKGKYKYKDSKKYSKKKKKDDDDRRWRNRRFDRGDWGRRNNHRNDGWFRNHRRFSRR